MSKKCGNEEIQIDAFGFRQTSMSSLNLIKRGDMIESLGIGVSQLKRLIRDRGFPNYSVGSEYGSKGQFTLTCKWKVSEVIKWMNDNGY